MSPSNGSISVSVSTSTISITITDTEGDLFNWTIETSPDIGNNSGVNNSSGVKTCSISGLEYSTTYYWYVNISDTGNDTSINNSYNFNTEDQSGGGGVDPYIPPPALPQNNEPETPSTPSGPTAGYVNISYNFTVKTTDSDNDKIKYKFDWGDGTNSDWSELIDSGNDTTMSNSWSLNGTYNIKVIAKDENGDESDWSDNLSVIIYSYGSEIESENETEIIIDIPDNPTSNESFEFNITEIEGLDDENLTYHWEFGDGMNGTGKCPNHSYSKPGTYVVILEIYDQNGLLVNTTTFEVTIYPEGEISTNNNKRDEGFVTDLILLITGIVVAIVILLLIVICKKNKKEKDDDFNNDEF